MDDKKLYELFNGKSLSGLFEDIYKNSSKTKGQINELIKQLTPFVKHLSDAAVIVPLIKEYLEVGVKNDEHLVKLADIVQRLIREDKKSVADVGLLTEHEKEQLLSEVKSYEEEKKNEDKKLKVISDSLERFKSEFSSSFSGSTGE